MFRFWKHGKKWLAGLLACAMLATGAAALAEAAVAPPAPAQSAAQEKAPEFTIETEDSLMTKAGLDTRTWDEAVAWEKDNGLSFPFTEEELLAANPDTRILRQDGRIYMIDRVEALGTVTEPMEAYRTVCRLSKMLAAAEDADLRLWSVVTTPMGLKVYVFQQVYEGLTVIASTVKIVTDQEGNVQTVISSLSAEMPESTGVTEITAEQAENAVRQVMAEQGMEDSVMPEYTTRAIMPLKNEMDDEDDEVYPDRLVWIVYSENPRIADGAVVDLPYLAHYVGTDGTYLHRNAVTMPGTSSAQGGFPAEYAFEFMEKGEWSGTVQGRGKTAMEITVPVMRDTRTGVWYLGDPERKIALGDFATMAYGDKTVKLLSSPENGGWEEEDLITYYNLIRAWDYYAEMGWIGPDGIGTPVLLLKGMCLKNGEDLENACYIGLVKGWQCFAYGKNSWLGQGLDVLTHEFTHGVTTTLMNTNLYLNDAGAINEAMSDIMGNLCEATHGEGDELWSLGENTGMIIRSMLDPHRYGQPEYVWDLYYGPHTDAPNELNDRGGVHINSSLLNLVAARLCAESGMPLDTAKRFWITAACGMTPVMDYPQMAELLRWAVSASGCEAYGPQVEALIAQTRMEETEIPETLGDNQVLVRLQLPDTGDITDERWVLVALQVDFAGIMSQLSQIKSLAFGAWKALWGGDEERAALNEQFSEFSESWRLDELLAALQEGDDSAFDTLLGHIFEGAVTQHMTWRAGETQTAAMVVRDLPTMYLLMNMDETDLSLKGFAVLIGKRWYDLTGMTALTEKGDPESEARLTEDMNKMVEDLMNLLLNEPGPEKAAPVQEKLTTIDLPTEGLSQIRLPEPEPEAEEPAAETPAVEEPVPQAAE